MSRAPVRLNVYDMYWLNDYASNIGFGIFHSGIEIYGVEYAYGGHPYTFSGVFENSPRDAEELGENFKFRQSILIGETDFTAADVRELIKTLGQEFRGDKYHLISRNCNHFTAVLSRCLPQEWLTPVALQQSLEGQRVEKRDPREREKRVSIDSAEEAMEMGSRLNGRQGASYFNYYLYRIVYHIHEQLFFLDNWAIYQVLLLPLRKVGRGLRRLFNEYGIKSNHRWLAIPSLDREKTMDTFLALMMFTYVMIYFRPMVSQLFVSWVIFGLYGLCAMCASSLGDEALIILNNFSF
uniref:DUF862 domain-containing protein n=1 Tax=Heterorhabditis bacteriophora TaxID=37862 RepID=A0A1I7XL27_HETBA